MTEIETWVRIVSALVALLVGGGPPLTDSLDRASLPPFAGVIRDVVTDPANPASPADPIPLDAGPPRRLLPLPDRAEGLARVADEPGDGRDRSASPRADRGHRRAGADRRPDRRRTAESAERSSAAPREQRRRATQRAKGRRENQRQNRDRTEWRPVHAAGNGGTASASANGGSVAIGSLPGDAEMDGDATVIETSTDEGIAVAIDAAGDTATASAAGQNGRRADDRPRGDPPPETRDRRRR